MKWARRAAAAVALLALLACGVHLNHSGSAPLAASPAGSLRVATLNVHYIITGKDSGAWSRADWHRRKGPMDAAFKAIDADLFALQESESFPDTNAGGPNLTLDWLLDQNRGYAVAAHGAADVFPPTQPILYRRDRLTLEEQGWFFFSDTPDVIYARTFNGSFPAFASWARFRSDGTAFYVVNVHFEYSSRSNRLQSADLVAERIAPWLADGARVMVVGDLNARLGSATARRIEQAGIAFAPVDGATYHFNRGIHLFGAIDHIGLSRGLSLATPAVAVRQQYQGEWPSDHYPVVADIVLD